LTLEEVHENGVIHRDIKPENMLVNDQEQLKIIDFNISEVLPADGNVRVTNKFIGTKGYAAPELIIGIEKEKSTSGKALDIWSLGITLLELLERKHPFTIKTIEELHKYLSQE
jgi:serine/threonine protein kinase